MVLLNRENKHLVGEINSPQKGIKVLNLKLHSVHWRRNKDVTRSWLHILWIRGIWANLWVNSAELPLGREAEDAEVFSDTFRWISLTVTSSLRAAQHNGEGLLKTSWTHERLHLIVPPKEKQAGVRAGVSCVDVPKFIWNKRERGGKKTRELR